MLIARCWGSQVRLTEGTAADKAKHARVTRMA